MVLVVGRRRPRKTRTLQRFDRAVSDAPHASARKAGSVITRRETFATGLPNASPEVLAPSTLTGSRCVTQTCQAWAIPLRRFLFALAVFHLRSSVGRFLMRHSPDGAAGGGSFVDRYSLSTTFRVHSRHPRDLAGPARARRRSWGLSLRSFDPACESAGVSAAPAHLSFRLGLIPAFSPGDASDISQ